MKTLPIFIAAVISTYAIAQSTAQSGHGIEFLPEVRKAPVGKAATDADLNSQRKALKFGGDTADETAPKGWDLVDYSDFIAFDEYYVILPKGSVIYVPEPLAAHIVQAPKGKMLGWNEFLTRYRAEVSFVSVTMDQVMGKKPLPSERMEVAAKSRTIVVAVFDGNPVTVLPVPEADTASTN